MLLIGIHNQKSALTSLLPLLTILGAILLLVGCSSGGATNATATPLPPAQETATSEPPTAPPSEAVTEMPATQETTAAAAQQPTMQASEAAVTEMPAAQVTETATEQLSATPDASPESTSDASATDEVGFSPVTRNADWTPVEREVNGVTMVLVPAGCFQMGRDDVSIGEAPEHEQCFEQPFWIDKTEVTNEQFARLNGEAELTSLTRNADNPRENISELEAAAFCTLRGARLSTELEWEYAATGPDNLIYPWGNEWVADNAVWEGNSRGRSAAVGSRPQNMSWVGALDMSGNVWEWTSSIDAAYPYNAVDGREATTNIGGLRIIRGGSWANQPQSLTTSFRLRNLPTVRDGKIGFRCVQDY